MFYGNTRRLSLRLLVNFLTNAPLDRSDNQRLCSAILNLAELLEFKRVLKSKVLQKGCKKDNSYLKANVNHVLKVLKKELANSKSDDCGILEQRIDSLASQLNLDKGDRQILELLVSYSADPVIEQFVDSVSNCFLPMKNSYFCNTLSVANPNPTFSLILAIPIMKLRERFGINSSLVQSGLVRVESDGDIEVLARIGNLVFEPIESTRKVHEILFEVSPPAELEWRDFEHVAPARDHIEKLMRGALKTHAKGVNILLYGPPGTGKTEFCKTLAEHVKLNLISVGESDEGSEPSRRKRLQELRLATSLLSESKNCILLFDEMEDLLSSPDSYLTQPRFRDQVRNGVRESNGSKVFVHRILEQNNVPTLWTTNSAQVTSPTILRRMMYAMELRQPSSRIRSRIWRRQLERHGVPHTHEDAESLALEFDVTPGVVDRAVAAAGLVEGGDISTVYRGVQSLAQMIHGPMPPSYQVDKFDPSLVCSSSDPVEIADQLSELNSRRFSVFLQGPPGTGKSAFIRYLAERVGLEVLQKRASDLLSMWVGGTEENISSAFREAREQEMFLVFDEADSLLADRRFAVRNWEVSQVNEMLTWMENHPFPFACTTNFGERIDPATLRRFDFKLKVDYLSPEKLQRAFALFFDMEAPADINALPNLTPGDFRVVHRRAELLGKINDASAIAAMLKEESEIKPARARPIGFGKN